VKLHRAGVVAQDADFDNGRQQLLMWTALLVVAS
jgi:hypothetical protein